MLIEEPFLTAFEHFSDLGQWSGGLCKLLVGLEIDGGNLVGPERTRSCLERVTDESRKSVLWLLVKMLQAAGAALPVNDLSSDGSRKRSLGFVAATAGNWVRQMRVTVMTAPSDMPSFTFLRTQSS